MLLTPPPPLAHTCTNINSEMGDPRVTLFLCCPLLPTWFPEPPFYTCLRLKWGSRDNIQQKLFLAADRNEAREQVWEKTWWNFLSETKTERKKWHPCSYFLVLRHTAQIDLETQFFLFVLYLYFHGRSSRTKEVKMLNYWDLGRNSVCFIGTSWHLT